MSAEFLKSSFRQILEQRENWFLWIPVFLGAGIVLYFSLPYEPAIRETGAFVSLTLIGCYLATRRLKWLLYLFIGLFLIAAGFMLAHFRTYTVAAPILEEDLRPTWAKGVIADIERTNSGDDANYRVILDDVSIWKFPKERTPKRVRIKVNTALNGAEVGDYVSIKAKLYPPKEPVFPGAYDFAFFSFFQQIGATGFALADVEIREKAKQRVSGLDYFFARLRAKVSDEIYLWFAGDGESEKKNVKASVSNALLTGEQAGIDKATIESMRKSGLGHLLSISGLHLVLVTGTCFLFIRFFLALIPAVSLYHNIKKWAAVVALLFGYFYLMLSGGAVPTQRAFIMVGFFILAVLLDRAGTPMRPVAFAAIVVLCLTPEAILTPSFQMSFSAVIALIAAFNSARWLNPENQTKNGFIRKSGKYLAASVFSSLIAGAATAPFGIYHFGNYAQYGILANLLAIPVTSFIVMPAGLIAMVLMPFGLHGAGLGVMGWGVGLIVSWSNYVSSLPQSSLHLPVMSDLALILISLGGLWLCFWRDKVRLLGTGLLAAGAIIAATGLPWPAIIADRGGKLFALHDGVDDYIFSDKTAARYSRETWARRFGHDESYKTLKDLERNPEYKTMIGGRGVDLDCTSERCVYRNGKYTTVILRPNENLPKDKLDYCANVDIVINLSSDSGLCEGAPLVITRDDLKDKGTHVLWFRPDGPIVKTVRGFRGQRPWVL